MVVPAKFRGQTHNVAIMSGTQMPTQESLDFFKHVYNDELKKLNRRDVSRQPSGHPDEQPDRDGSASARSIRPGNHPLLLSKDHANRYMDIMLECARARLAAQGRLTSTN